MPIPICLLLDDCAPVNNMHAEGPAEGHEFLVPGTFTHDFADVCARHGVKGKFTVLPMASCLGRLDRGLAGVPPAHVVEFIRIVRDEIRPRFDLSPELLTHLRAHDLATGGYTELREDAWVAQAPVAELAPYLTLALRILDNVGLTATGVTSPWSTGITREGEYAAAIGEAQWCVHRRQLTWYFLHVVESGPPRPPSVTLRDARRGQTVVSIPANTGDPFWGAQSRDPAARDQAVADGLAQMLSEDGRQGRLREVFDAGVPITICTHWQSLFAQGSAAGLRGFEQLVARVATVFGDQVEWVTCHELARRTVNATRG